MRRILTITIATLLLLLTLAVGALYWALQSQYAGMLVNRVSQQLGLPLQVSQARYHFPNQLSFRNIEVRGRRGELNRIEQADLWVTPLSLLTGSPVIESLLLNGLSLQQGLPSFDLPGWIQLRQLAIKNLDYADSTLSSRDISLQIKNPTRESADQLIPYGTIQFSAGQVYWQGEAFDNLLLDADYKPHSSTIYGLSFNWRGGTFSGQAEQYDTGWSLVNTTFKELRLKRKQWQHLQQLGIGALGRHIAHINSLDLLSSSIETDSLAVTNFDLSIEHFDLTEDIWQQKNGYLSLSGESLRYQGHLLLEPLFAVELNPGRLNISELSAEFQQGLINARGTITPDSTKLEQLSVSGLKWIAESADTADLLTDTLESLHNLSVEQLDIRHSQFIQLHGRHKWQLSGLNMEGRELIVKKDAQWGLWQGKLEASAASASFDRLLASQPMLRMQNRDNNWQLDDLFIPLENGLLEATGNLDLSSLSRPWRLELAADGLPVELLSQWYPLPVALEGIAEFQLSASGLGGDAAMLRHSLSSELAGSIREAAVVSSDEEAQQQTKPLHVSELQLSAKRGVFSLTPLVLEGESLLGILEADFDLASEQQSRVTFKLQQRCQEQTWDLLRDSQSLRVFCAVDTGW
jgi:hypothetical protein